jgi:hypothetical protein
MIPTMIPASRSNAPRSPLGAGARMMRGLALMLSGLALLLIASLLPVAPAAASDDPVGHLGALLNEARQQAGVAPLAVEGRLAEVAWERTHDMATRRYFSHTTPEGKTVLSILPERGVNYALAGETLQRNNFAADQSVAEAARSLLASPAHRAILLDERFSMVGIGHGHDGDLHYYAVVLVQP